MSFHTANFTKHCKSYHSFANFYQREPEFAGTEFQTNQKTV